MRHIEIYIPFALPHKDVIKELLKEWQSPALATVVARGRSVPNTIPPMAVSRALPHEVSLSYRYGLLDSHEAENSPPAAVAAMQSLGIKPDEGFWFSIHPVHFMPIDDHIFLDEPRILDLSDAESRILYESARAIFEEEGYPLLYGNVMNWFARADHYKDLLTTTPDSVTGRPIDFWLPMGHGERAWRDLHDKVKAMLAEHPLNAKRQKEGKRIVNGLWLWGCGDASRPVASQLEARNAKKIPDRCQLSGWMRVFEMEAHRSNWIFRVEEWLSVVAGKRRHVILTLDDLSAFAIRGDWGGWLAACNELERGWYAPLLDAIQHHRLDRLTLHFSNDEKMRSFTITRQALGKFWIRPSLKKLQS